MNVINDWIKISTVLLLACISASANSSIGDKDSIRISRHEKLKSLKDPNSCESIYYKLGEQKRVTTIQNDLRTQFKNVRILYNKNIDKQMKELGTPQLSKEMKNEIDAVQLEIYQAPLRIGKQGAILQYKYADVPNRMQINRWAFENRPEAVNAFWMGHEFAHASDWVPPQVAECLESPSSYGARRNGTSYVDNKDKDLEIFWKHVRSLSKKKSEPGNKQLKLDFKVLEDPGGGYNEGFGTDSISRFERLATVDIKAGHLVIDILEGKKKFKSLEKREVEYLNSIITGLSTDQLTVAEKLFNQGNANWADGSFKWIQQLPRQMDEAIADYQGTLLAVDFINKKMKTPAEKKEAALAILRSFPPELYKDDVHSLMSRVGSKKPNEDRVLRILLANPDFRNFLDCEFETKPEPKFCPLVASRKSTPIQNFFNRFIKVDGTR